MCSFSQNKKQIDNNWFLMGKKLFVAAVVGARRKKRSKRQTNFSDDSIFVFVEMIVGCK